MPRFIPPAISDFFDDPLIGVAFLVELAFSEDEAPLRLWTGIADLDWDGKTWQGNGWLKAPRQIEETSELRAVGMEIILSGIPQDLIALVFRYSNHSRRCRVFLAITDGNGTLIAQPHLCFVGRFDQAEIKDSDTTSELKLSYESHLIDLGRTNGYRYSHESQMARFPGDLGFVYLERLSDWDGVWMMRPPRAERTKTRRTERNKK